VGQYRSHRRHHVVGHGDRGDDGRWDPRFGRAHPGGVGAVEVALIGRLTAFGVPAAIAVPSVLLYRVLDVLATGVHRLADHAVG
jgi:hypothetical protein